MNKQYEVLKGFKCRSCGATMVPGVPDCSLEDDGCIICFLDVVCPDCEKELIITLRPSELAEA